MKKSIHRHIDQLHELDAYAKTLDPESTTYWEYHRHRFAWSAELIEQLVAALRHHGADVERILDIGNSYQTLLLDQIFPDIRVDTMGFLCERYAPQREFTHYPFDLNNAYDETQWPLPEGGGYDVIVFLEVIEHLYTAPTIVLRFLKSFLKDHGFLVIGTPIASALKKRIRLLGGKNPYELIRENRMNPGHFREYTIEELCHLGHESGFHVDQIHANNLFVDGNRMDRFCDSLSNYLPPSFRSAQTVVFRKAPATS